MKKSMKYLFSLPLILAFTACGSPAGSQPAGGEAQATVQGITVSRDEALASRVPDGWVTDGVLKAPVMLAPPTGILSPEGKAEGLVPDLVTAIAAKLGLKAELEMTSFDAQVPGAVSGQYAMTTDTGDFPDRRKVLNMVDYLKSGTAFVTLASNPKGIKAMDDMCGLRIGVIKGTVQEGNIEAFGQQCEAKGLAQPEISAVANTVLTLPLQANRVDVVWDSINAYAGYSRAEPNTYIMPVPPVYDAYVAFGVPVEKEELRDLLKDTVQSLVDDGTYGRLIDHWNLQDLAVSEITVNSDITEAG